MLHHWTGVKPLKRYVNDYGTRGAEKGRVTGTHCVEFKRGGPPFEPTNAELRDFSDLMETVGAGLTYSGTVAQGELSRPRVPGVRGRRVATEAVATQADDENGQSGGNGNTGEDESPGENENSGGYGEFSKGK